MDMGARLRVLTDGAALLSAFGFPHETSMPALVVPRGLGLQPYRVWRLVSDARTPGLLTVQPHLRNEPGSAYFTEEDASATWSSIERGGHMTVDLDTPTQESPPRQLSVDESTKALVRRWAYPVALAVVYVVWTTYMFASDSWYLFKDFWPISLTMSAGSFVAGATAEGGAAIAFPVFTKVLHIPPPDARTFGLMIQSVGMSMAALVIIVRQVPILPRVILWVSVGGVFGQILGTFWLSLGTPYSKILFTFVAAVFGVALAISRWGLKWEPRSTLPTFGRGSIAIYITIGVAGGAFAANTGSGIDIATFIFLTLAIGINEKVSTPTTVIIMAINSIVGFALQGLVVGDIGIAFNYWLVAIPIVVIGAPLGAYAASYATRDMIIGLLLSLITLELVTTIILIPMSPLVLAVIAVSIIGCSVAFLGMLRYRHRLLDDYPITEQPESLSPA